MKTKARRIKAQPPKPPAAVTVTLSSNDFGQMMDGLRSRLESWDNTVLHFDGESEYDMQVEECSDQEEARNIANHYRALIADLEKQSKHPKPGYDLLKHCRKYVSHESDIDLLENVAAISAELWSGQARCHFYERFGDELSGFPGVWLYSIDAARAFTKAEERFGREIGTKPKASYEYLDAILPFAEWLSTRQKLPTQAELEAKAWETVLAAKN